jgi:uncharacterized coiled-coil protein SlyX
MLTPFAMAGVLACGPSEEVQRQLAELQAVSAEKDSLLTQVADNARLMSEISAEVARVQTAQAGAQETAGPPDPSAVRESIAGITRRIEESEARLAESQKRIQTLTRENRAGQTKLTELEKTIEDFQATIANQRLTIESLNTQVAELQQQNVQLVTQNTDLTTKVEDMTVRDHTVYYVVGTKEELLEKGIIEEQGGSRVLFVFGKRGKTIVPGRNLDMSMFNTIDRTVTTDIPMPVPEAGYTIVTRQDLSALSTTPDEKGRFVGEIRIADPERFWASSKVLIVVQS